MMEKYVSPILESIRNQGMEEELKLAHGYAWEYMQGVDERPVFPRIQDLKNLQAFEEALKDEPEETKDIITQLHQFGSPATVASTGGRYFGFVTGGILPSALASKWISDTWDQNSGLYLMSPIASKLETVVQRWMVELLKLPKETVAGYVSGSSTATLIGLATGRNLIMDRAGYPVFKEGLFNAPTIKVVLGQGAHSTVYKALSILGLGNERVITVPVDEQGRMRADQLPEMDDHTLLILQAGHVCTGDFDDFERICQDAKEAGAYIHIDGAFGLWAAANDQFNHLTKGMELADSWSVDGHKTLNTPYDSGVILCRHEKMLIQSMQMAGSYIQLSEDRDGMLYTAEMSRRARAIELWATLKGLGKKGVADLVWELHRKAVYFAKKLECGGLEILNEVVFNQVLVRFKSDEMTNRLIKEIQDSGVCWLGGSTWQDSIVMRISVSSYKTTYEDIDRSVADILRLAKK
ncbi:aminotransferase class V-fold PLP-dependent enzyme [Gottschalkiaceae bacterium SANA]|nr:aminotransferase class V-fold PLP-dependent enzyme [Gottschalkiaceae bacterium SANA]